MLDIKQWYPSFVINTDVKAYLEAEQIVLDDEERALLSLMSEFTVETATFTLPLWATLGGVEDNKELPLDIRRSNIIASFRAKDITTPMAIKSIVESYSNAECEVTEVFGEYYFIIKFVSKVGKPSRIDQIQTIIDKIKPAHLGYKFIFRYRTWGEVNALNKTYKTYKAGQKTWLDFKESEVI